VFLPLELHLLPQVAGGRLAFLTGSSETEESWPTPVCVRGAERELTPAAIPRAGFAWAKCASS